MDFPEEQLLEMRYGALLHDIGKLGVPFHILMKPGPLNDDEWAIMREHPTRYFFGRDAVRRANDGSAA